MYLKKDCKNLFLLRHGRAEQFDFLEDRNRDLTSEGVDGVISIGNFLAENNIKIDYILSSPALRAFKTAELIKKTADFDCNIVTEEVFYFYNIKTIIEKIKTISDNFNNVLLVGHNPTWQDIVRELSCQNTRVSMSPGSLVCLQTDIKSWSEIEKGSFVFNFMQSPKY